MPQRGVNFNHLYYFHVVATSGSQSEAARKLGLRPSTISEQVRKVEQLLGSTLFERTKTGLKLNDHGRKCLEFTQTMFETSARLMDAFDRKTALRAELEIGVTASVSRAFAADYLLPLFEQPEILPRITVGQDTALMERLSSGRLDILLSGSPPVPGPHANVTSQCLAQLDFAFVATPNLIDAHDGQPLPVLHFPAGSAWRFALDDCLRRASDREIEVVGESDDVGLLARAALSGKTAATIPRDRADAALGAGELRLVAEIDCQLPVHLHYVEDAPADIVDRAIQILLSLAQPKQTAPRS